MSDHLDMEGMSLIRLAWSWVFNHFSFHADRMQACAPDQAGMPPCAAAQGDAGGPGAAARHPAGAAQRRQPHEPRVRRTCAGSHVHPNSDAVPACASLDRAAQVSGEGACPRVQLFIWALCVTACRPVTQRILQMQTPAEPGAASGRGGTGGASSGAQRHAQGLGQTAGERSWRAAAAAEEAALAAERSAAEQGAGSFAAIDPALLRSLQSRMAQHGAPEQALGGGSVDGSTGSGSSESSQQLSGQSGQWRESIATSGEGCGLPRSQRALHLRACEHSCIKAGSAPAWWNKACKPC